MPLTRLSGPALHALDTAPRLAIHSVFDTAVNLRAGRRLIACTSRRLSAPHGVEVTPDDLNRLRDRGHRQPSATLHWNTCRQQLADATGELTIRPAPGLVVFDPVLPVFGPTGWQPGVAALLGHLTQRELRTGFGADWPALVNDPHLVAALAALACGHVDDAVRYWLGRGVGLTPSGDDVVVGALAALWSSGRLGDWTTRSLAQQLESAVRSRTNEIAAEYLRYACRGMAAGPVHGLLVALRSHDAAVADAAARLAGYGHTSGMDVTLGVVAALRTDWAGAP